MAIARTLVRSSIARVTALYTSVLALSMLLVLAVTYFTAARLLDNEANELIDLDAQSLLESYHDHDFATFKSELIEHVEDPQAKRSVYELRDAHNQFVAGNVVVLPQLSGTPNDFIEFDIGLNQEQTENSRLIRARVLTLPNGFRLLVGHDIEDRETFRALILKSMASSVVMTLLFGALGGWWLGRRVVKTNQGISDSAAKIIAGNLSERLPTTGNNDEFDALVNRFNELISTIENLTLTLRSVLDSTAHDLRGHLHRIQQAVEHLKRDLDQTADSSLTDHVLQEVERLNLTVEGLLRIALAESGNVTLEPISLSTIVADLCEFYEPLAPQRFAVSIESHISIKGHRVLLNQALSNLLDNAIKYSDGVINVRLTHTARGVALSVTDQGPGIPDAWIPLATQRFRRLPSPSGLPGSGIGLSLVAAVARLHQAALTLSNQHPGFQVEVLFQPLSNA